LHDATLGLLLVRLHVAPTTPNEHVGGLPLAGKGQVVLFTQTDVLPLGSYPVMATAKPVPLVTATAAFPALRKQLATVPLDHWVGVVAVAVAWAVMDMSTSDPS
jgi:hypothetical protein